VLDDDGFVLSFEAEAEAREAADRRWSELVREVNKVAPAQPAPGQKNRRTRSGQ
jgi:hypothetical protein